MAYDPKRLIPVLVIAALAAGGVLLDRTRERARSHLGGTFDSQPSRLASRIDGRVLEIYVKDGDTVKKGQTLVLMEAASAGEDAAALKQLAQQAKLKAAELIEGPRKEDILRQEAVVAEAAANLRRLQNGPLPEEIAVLAKKAESAKARYDLVRKGPKKADIEASLASLREAEARLAQGQRGGTAEERAQVAARTREAQADKDQAQRDSDRAKRLYAEGAISLQDQEATQTRLAVSQARLDAAIKAEEESRKGTPTEELNQARQAVERAKAQYRSLSEGSRPEEIAQAKSDWEAAQESLAQIKRGSRPEDIAAAAARLAQAEALLLSLKNGSRKVVVQQAEAAAKAAEAQAASADTRISERKLIAPSDGVVERVLVAKGDLMGVGAQIIQFADPTDIWLRVYLAESQLAKVKVGDSATLLVDGVAGETPAIVDAIATQGEFTPVNLQTPEERGKQVFAIRLRLKNPDPRVKAGMSATVSKVGSWP